MKTWKKVSAGEINAANQRLWAAIGSNAQEIANRINTDPAFVKRVARFITDDGCESSASHALARDIMGKNFFGAAEAALHFGVCPTKEQLDVLATIPFSENMLRSCRSTHVLVAVFPLSIFAMYGIAQKNSDQILFYARGKSDEWEFAKDAGECDWQLVRKEPVLNSTQRSWEEQKLLLMADEEVPTARVVVYTMVGHFLATGEHLFASMYVRCADSGPEYTRSLAGYFHDRGLNVRLEYQGDRGYNIGLASAKKSDV